MRGASRQDAMGGHLLLGHLLGGVLPALALTERRPQVVEGGHHRTSVIFCRNRAGVHPGYNYIERESARNSCDCQLSGSATGTLDCCRIRREGGPLSLRTRVRGGAMGEHLMYIYIYIYIYMIYTLSLAIFLAASSSRSRLIRSNSCG